MTLKLSRSKRVNFLYDKRKCVLFFLKLLKIILSLKFKNLELNLISKLLITKNNLVLDRLF
jgi:hypothetical protein